MTAIEIDVAQSIDHQLRAAMRSDLSKQTNSEGRSALDFLIARIQHAKSEEKKAWTLAASELVAKDRSRSADWWYAFERLVVLGDLVGPDLGNALEQIASNYSQLDSSARASLYALMDACGKPMSASFIAADHALKADNRLKWLDLMIARLPRREDARELVLEAVKDGKFKLDDFVHRLNEMRELGGPQLGRWLNQFGETLSLDEKAAYEQLTDKIFGPLVPVTPTSKFQFNATVDLKTMREIAISDPQLASLPIGVALRRIKSGRRITEVGPTLALLQKATSFNQAHLAQYHYLSAEKHKHLKQLMSSRQKSPTSIKAAVDELLNYSFNAFHQATVHNFDFLKAYFSMRGSVAPRICLKGNFQVNDAETIVSIFRDSSVGYYSDTEIEKNTGFHSIKGSGAYFLENNIPRAVLQGKYVNPRIKLAEIKARFNKADKKNIAKLDAEWRSFWEGSESSDAASFYKSTMVVPLSLFNNEISGEFKKSFDLDIERSIFGFLCIDHQDVDYFDKSSDVFSGKIFADILCTFAFTRLVFTDFSTTFRAATRFLSKNEKSPKLTKMPPDRASHQIAGEFEKYLTPPEGMLGPPNLVATDQMLLNFARSKSRQKPK